jgi:hypothetical protein
MVFSLIGLHFKVFVTLYTNSNPRLNLYNLMGYFDVEYENICWDLNSVASIHFGSITKPLFDFSPF